MSFPSDFSALSLQQLKQLIDEFGPQPALMREVQVKSLMARVDGMDRRLALSLVGPGGDPGGREVQDSGAELLAHLFVRAKFTEAQLMELKQFCSDGGVKRFNRAMRAYLNDDWHAGVSDAMHRLLVDAFHRQQSAAVEGSDVGADDEWQQTQAEVDDYDQQLKLRQHLSETWGINCAADWYCLLEAMECAKKRLPERGDVGLAYWNRLTKAALRLRDRAQAMNTKPSKLDDWEHRIRPSIKNGTANKNAVYQRPDGVCMWGDGEMVVMDSKGQPQRRAASVFGGDVPANEQPSLRDIGLMVDQAFQRI